MTTVRLTFNISKGTDHCLSGPVLNSGDKLSYDHLCSSFKQIQEESNKLLTVLVEEEKKNKLNDGSKISQLKGCKFTEFTSIIQVSSSDQIWCGI